MALFVSLTARSASNHAALRAAERDCRSAGVVGACSARVRGAQRLLPAGASLTCARREVSRLRLRFLSDDGARRLLAEGRAFLVHLEEELRQGLAPQPVELDSSVVVSDDAPREILLRASRRRSRLICLGAPERSLAPQGDPVERILRDTPSDVAVYGGLD